MPHEPVRTETVIIFERTPYWEPELRRQFADEAIIVRACRTVTDLEERVCSSPDAVAVACLETAPFEILRWLSQQLVNGRPLRTVVVISEDQRPLEWQIREAGAVAVVSDVTPGHQMARLIQKQWLHRHRQTATDS